MQEAHQEYEQMVQDHDKQVQKLIKIVDQCNQQWQEHQQQHQQHSPSADYFVPTPLDERGQSASSEYGGASAVADALLHDSSASDMKACTCEKPFLQFSLSSASTVRIDQRGTIVTEWGIESIRQSIAQFCEHMWFTRHDVIIARGDIIDDAAFVFDIQITS